jgi:hypothetical protein
MADPPQWRHANPILEVADVKTALGYYRRVFGLVPTWMWGANVADL